MKESTDSDLHLLYFIGGLLGGIVPIWILLSLMSFLQTFATDVQKVLIMSLAIGASIGLGGLVMVLGDLRDKKTSLQATNNRLRNVPILFNTLVKVYKIVLNEHEAAASLTPMSIETILTKVVDLFDHHGANHLFDLAARGELPPEINLPVTLPAELADKIRQELCASAASQPSK